jgi:hypothetical protein
MPVSSDAPLMQGFLQGLIQQLMAQKQAIASRDLSALEGCQQTLAGLWHQLQKASPQQLTAYPVECQTIQLLTQDSMTLLANEYQRVGTLLAMVAPGTYQAGGQPALDTDLHPRQECLA